MQCTFCGQENPSDSSFCSSCGNNLTQEVILGEQTTQAAVTYQPMEFKVTQKIFSLTPTYKVADSSGREIMVASKNFFSFFRPEYIVKQPDGTPIGRLQGNFFRTEWQIIDEHEKVHAIVRFPFFIFITKSFTVETGLGLFRSGSSVFGKRFDAYDPSGALSFVVDKKLISIRDTFKIQSNGLLSPFITCMAAVCIDRKFHSSK